MREIDLHVIEDLYLKRHRYFYRVALGLLNGDADGARDAVQEAFARAIRARQGFRGEGTVESWIWRTLTNVCLRQRRVELTADPFAGEGASIDLDVSQWAHVRKAIAGLPERQRLILFLRHYADLDYEQIAAIARVERGTVAAALHAAHAKLRATIEEPCHE